MQLELTPVPKDQLKRAWAFARIDRRRGRKPKDAYKRSVITTCSYQAKLFGIRAGMKYDEATQLVPGMRILVIGT